MKATPRRRHAGSRRQTQEREKTEPVAKQTKGTFSLAANASGGLNETAETFSVGYERSGAARWNQKVTLSAFCAGGASSERTQRGDLPPPCQGIAVEPYGTARGPKCLSSGHKEKRFHSGPLSFGGVPARPPSPVPSASAPAETRAHRHPPICSLAASSVLRTALFMFLSVNNNLEGLSPGTPCTDRAGPGKPPPPSSLHTNTPVPSAQRRKKDFSREKTLKGFQMFLHQHDGTGVYW